MKSIIIFITVCVFVVASGLHAFGEEWTAEKKEVIETVRAIWEAFKDGDVEATKVGALSKSQLTAFIDSHL